MGWCVICKYIPKLALENCGLDKSVILVVGHMVVQKNISCNIYMVLSALHGRGIAIIPFIIS